MDHILDLKNQGIIKHIGASSHTPSVIQEILDTDLIDMLRFSVNPAYDYSDGEYAFGGVDERADVYKRCEKMGVGISVMKPFSGGQLLSSKASPFGQALTQYQCIKYALDKPGVLTVLPGAKSVSEVEDLLKYFDQKDEDLDYSVSVTFPAFNPYYKYQETEEYREYKFVVYEEIYLNTKDESGKDIQILIGQHKNLRDANQTVTNHVIQTGDETPIAIFAGFCVLALVGAGVVIRKKRRMGCEEE